MSCRHCEEPLRRSNPWSNKKELLRCARNDDLTCYHPRKRVIQYSRDISDKIEKPRRTGCPAFAGHDDQGLLLLRLLPTDGLQLGEHGVDVEVVALLLARLELGFLAGGF